RIMTSILMVLTVATSAWLFFVTEGSVTFSVAVAVVFAIFILRSSKPFTMTNVTRGSRDVFFLFFRHICLLCFACLLFHLQLVPFQPLQQPYRHPLSNAPIPPSN